MQVAEINGANIHYEVIGNDGPWVALSPGGRRGGEGARGLATRMAGAGYRVVIHDRRNCGASDLMLDGELSEYEIWADDLAGLLAQLGAGKAVIGGASSGCRLSALAALRHPELVSALLLWRVTAGKLACDGLAETYYGEYITAAQKGGMKAVCETEHFSERILDNPANGEKLMAMDPEKFIAIMSHWRSFFLEGADLPIIGATEEDLRSIQVPCCVVPGNDQRHTKATGHNLHSLLPNSELHEVMAEELDIELGPHEDWDAVEGDLARLFVSFIRRN